MNRLSPLPAAVWAMFAASLLCCLMANGAEPGQTPDTAADGPRAAKPADLGPPLVDNVDELRRLDPKAPVWLDGKRKRVVFVGETCQAGYGLEFLVTFPDRGYESVLVATVKPSVVHAALIALGAQPGRPATFQPRFAPASGMEIEILLAWKGTDGTRRESRAQEWIRDTKTKLPPTMNWVFGGSGFWVDDTTGKRHYQAEGGDFIAVANVPIATLDLPMRSATALESRVFEANPDRLPPKGTPVTIILTPKLEKAK